MGWWCRFVKDRSTLIVEAQIMTREPFGTFVLHWVFTLGANAFGLIAVKSEKPVLAGFSGYITGCKGIPSHLQRKPHNETGSHLQFRGAHHRKQNSQREQRHLEREAEYVSYQVTS